MRPERLEAKLKALRRDEQATARIAADTGRTQNRRGAPRRFTALARGAVELALVAVIAMLLARAVWFGIYGGEIDRLSADMVAPSARLATDEAPTDLTILAEGRLFASAAFEAEVDPVESAPETQLDLTLRGVRRGPTPQSGAAVVQTPQEGQRTVAIGGEIAPNVTLEAVYADRVIINRRGNRESLFLREQSARSTSFLQPGAEPPAAEAESRAPGPRAAGGLSEEDWVRGLRLAPVEETADARGYRILAESDPALLDATGLRTGDIITSVNGRALAGSVNTLEVLEELAEASEARFTVLRDGESQTIEVRLR
ncbi:hypothetical protein DDZ18_10495 [Marinicauda salina]|uniref:PDZ domain-containing protein n=1 Tax=Marinicauda salina TaxID=2135793 RepID=A0A2U2BSY0_9PROT|nr:type II secretion system protein N [Marinicauda salina]PWE17119.1 hypothetical protein DDZ18_10495 [Marinicauda salina]